jgi:hypothetical protein
MPMQVTPAFITIRIVSHRPHYLINHAIDAVIAPLGDGNPVAKRIGKRQATCTILLIVELAKMVPLTDIDASRWARRIFSLIVSMLRFSHEQWRILEDEN